MTCGISPGRPRPLACGDEIERRRQKDKIGRGNAASSLLGPASVDYHRVAFLSTTRQNVKCDGSRSCLPGRTSLVPLGKRDLLAVLAGRRSLSRRD